MTLDLNKLLHQAAGEPDRVIPVEEVVRRAGRVRTKRIVTFSGALLLAASCALFVFLRIDVPSKRPSSPEIASLPSSSPSSSAGASQDSKDFRPGTYEEGGNRVMPIAFLDGTAAEMVFPAEAGLEATAITFHGDVFPGAPDFILQSKSGSDLKGSIVSWWGWGGFSDDRPSSEYPDGRGGTIKKWRPSPNAAYGSDASFGFGPWIIGFNGRSAGLSANDADLIEENLTGLETSNGFLVLDSRGPLKLWGGGVEPAALELRFGDVSVQSRCGRFFGQGEEINGLEVHTYEDGSRSWCDQTEHFEVYVGDPDLATALIGSLYFRDFHVVPRR